MANILTGLIPVIYEARDIVARELIGMIPAVTIDAQASQAAVGQTVRAYVTPSVTASNVTPGVTVDAGSDESLSFKDLVITNSKAAKWHWNGEEQRSVGSQYDNIIRDQFVQAFRAIGNSVEQSLVQTAVGAASRAVGTAGTTPFGTAGDLSDFANVNQVLDDNGTPMTDRHLVLNTTSYNKIAGKQSTLFKVNEAGTDQLLRQGIVNQVENLSMHKSAQLAKHFTGLSNVAAAYMTVGANVASDTLITANASMASANAGDVVVFAGDTNQYVVQGGAGSVANLSAPGLLNATANATTFTSVGNYVPNIGLHKNSVLLAARSPLLPAGGDAASESLEVYDAISGLTYQVVLYRTYRQINIEVALAWGSLAVKPQFITILMG